MFNAAEVAMEAKKKNVLIYPPASEDEISNFQRLFLVNGQPFFPLGGQVHNSSAYTAADLEPGWKALAALHANTAEIPVYWEQVEPVEGQYDFCLVDHLLAEARARGLKLILLWFGAWKNSLMKYAPEWVKAAPERFWRVRGPAGEALAVLSPHCPATREADKRALCALLDRLEEADGDQATVIAVQLENEAGILGCDRDYSPEAERAYHSPVPADLVEIMQIAPLSRLHAYWQQAGGWPHGTWPEMFGPAAGDLFTAWNLAQFIDDLAVAGKAHHDVPMYVNAWLGSYGWRAPGLTYPAGGATYHTLDIWRWAAAHVDLIAPDLYHRSARAYCQACADYRRKDNTLFVPESLADATNARHMFYAIADYNAIGYAIFGVEDVLDADGLPRPEARPLVESFRATAAAAPLILRYQGTGQIYAVVQEESQTEQYLDLGGYAGLAQFAPDTPGIFRDFRHPAPAPEERGRGLVVQAGPREFYAVGAAYRLLFRKKASPQELQQALQVADWFGGRLTNYLRVEEGHFDAESRWQVDRRRNGDESDHGLWVAPDVGVVHALLSD